MRRTLNIFSSLLFVIVSIGWIVQENAFVVEHNDQKISVKIENGIGYLRYDQNNQVTITTHNINGGIRASAPGLRLVRGQNSGNTSVWDLMPIRKNIKNDTLKLSLAARDANDSTWTHQFKILVK